jgi:hypothetical protein
MAQFNVLSRHLIGGGEENEEKSQSSRSPGRELNPESLEYKQECQPLGHYVPPVVTRNPLTII